MVQNGAHQLFPVCGDKILHDPGRTFISKREKKEENNNKWIDSTHIIEIELNIKHSKYIFYRSAGSYFMIMMMIMIVVENNIVNIYKKVFTFRTLCGCQGLHMNQKLQRANDSTNDDRYTCDYFIEVCMGSLESWLVAEPKIHVFLFTKYIYWPAPSISAHTNYKVHIPILAFRLQMTAIPFTVILPFLAAAAAINGIRDAPHSTEEQQQKIIPQTNPNSYSSINI